MFVVAWFVFTHVPARAALGRIQGLIIRRLCTSKNASDGSSVNSRSKISRTTREQAVAHRPRRAD
jgi:hypothetical protein